MDWIEKNLWALVGFISMVAGWFMSLGRVLYRIKSLENDNVRFIADMKEVRKQCSGVSCAEQRARCDDRYATKADVADNRSIMMAGIGEVKEMICEMDNRREAARSAMQARWDEISRFMGETKARMEMERKR